MSEITDRIEQYADTRQGFDDLVDFLAAYKYGTPERYKTVRDPTKEEDWYGYDDGTWDEVAKAHAMGLLTDDEYLKVAEAAWAHGSTRTS